MMETFGPVDISPSFSEATLCSLLAVDVDVHFELFIKVYHIKVRAVIQQIFASTHLAAMDKVDRQAQAVFLQMYGYLKNLKPQELLQLHLWAKLYQFTMDRCFTQLVGHRQTQIDNAILAIVDRDTLQQGAVVITLAGEIFTSLKEQLNHCDQQIICEPQCWLWLHNSILAYCFEQLFERYRPQLEAFVVRLSSNVDDAEDIVQQSLLSAFQHLKAHGVPSQGHFDPKGWIFAIAKNAFRKSLRKNNPMGKILSLDVLSQEHPIFDIEDGYNVPPHIAFELAETHSYFVALVSQLSEPYREVIWLRFFEGLSNDEIATQLSKKPVTVRSLIHRGIKLLRQRMLDEQK